MTLALLLCLSGLYVFWHYRTHRHLLRDEGKTGIKLWIDRLHKTGSLPPLLLLAVFAVTLGISDIRLASVKRHVGDLEASNRNLEDNLSLLLQPEPPTQPANRLADEMIDTVAAPRNAMQDVYNPEETSTGADAAMDGIKKRFEEILVTYFYLRKCNIAPATDYHVIISALSQEMASVNAPGRLQYDILVAAQGSYKEMYARSDCAGNHMEALTAQYIKYVKTLSDNLPALPR